MKYLIVIFITGMISLVISDPSHLHAQSGSRSVGGISSGGASVRRGVSRGGSSSRGIRRLGSVGRQQLSPQQLQLQRQQAQQSLQQTAQQRARQAKQQRKQDLIDLGLRKNRSANLQQYKRAFAEAKSDYQDLRQGRIAPVQVGQLQQPFRLTKRDIDRAERTANWPKALQSEKFSAIVDTVDSAIMDNSITTDEAATAFLSDLDMLNSALNAAAVEGEVNVSNYARARRFITGLVNEIRATNLVM